RSSIKRRVKTAHSRPQTAHRPRAAATPCRPAPAIFSVFFHAVGGLAAPRARGHGVCFPRRRPQHPCSCGPKTRWKCVMTAVTKPLFSLTAADLMTAPLVTVSEEMSLRGAAHRLAQAAVTGAPVVNGNGRCVGVLSATDFVHWVDRGPD